jgi:hypothetical protein
MKISIKIAALVGVCLAGAVSFASLKIPIPILLTAPPTMVFSLNIQDNIRASKAQRLCDSGYSEMSLSQPTGQSFNSVQLQATRRSPWEALSLRAHSKQTEE